MNQRTGKYFVRWNHWAVSPAEAYTHTPANAKHFTSKAEADLNLSAFRKYGRKGFLIKKLFIEYDVDVSDVG